MSSTVTGNLTLIDENDNTPRFSQSSFFKTIPEDLRSSTTIMTFLATDADKGLNGEVEYRIDGDMESQFIEGEEDVVLSIDRSSGRLFAINNFNYERSTEVNVTVIANDRGIPRRSSSALLVITVTNVDERRPVFLQSQCSRSLIVSESVTVGTTVAHCHATDFDTTATANETSVTYALNSPYFDINSTTGAITSKVLLDRESSNGAISLQIVATDLAQKTETRLVSVVLSDVNDNSPQFLNTSYHYHFTSDDIENNLRDFLTIEVSDPDAGENGTFSLSVNKIMRLTETETLLEVIAQDDGVPRLTSSVNVTVAFQSPCQLQLYSISDDDNRHQISAKLLCSVSITHSAVAFTLQQSSTLTCRIISNTLSVLQWLQNGTAITSTELIPINQSDTSLTLRNIRFSDAGQYACRATTDAGSLQSVAARASVEGKSSF